MEANFSAISTKIVLKAVHIAMALAMFMCAYIQLNDPDPYFWSLMYGVCALVPLLSLFGRYSIAVCWAGMLLCSVGVGISTTGMLEYLRHIADEPLMQPMSNEKVYIEEAREMIGALIALVMVLVYFTFAKPKPNTK